MTPAAGRNVKTAMRERFASEVIARFSADPECFFLTVDVGFMALEGVRDAFGARFINAGVAEQNLIGVAAGLAREGCRVFCYSIASFLYARPFEQIRNNLAFTGLPVCLVGNGGGYAYGHMGPTHHALEDAAVMHALGVRVQVPAFDDDIPAIIGGIEAPTYLRLGRDHAPPTWPGMDYAPWRRVLAGTRGVLVALGPLAGVALRALGGLACDARPAVWAATDLDADSAPGCLWEELAGNTVFVIEEHAAAGGLGMVLGHAMARRRIAAKRFVHRHAIMPPDGRHGSQAFHWARCGFDEAGILAMINEP
jgi:transketolase